MACFLPLTFCFGLVVNVCLWVRETWYSVKSCGDGYLRFYLVGALLGLEQGQYRLKEQCSLQNGYACFVVCKANVSAPIKC